MEKVLLHLYKLNSINDRDCETVSYRYGNRYGEFPNRLVNSSVKRLSFLPPHVTIRLIIGTMKEFPLVTEIAMANFLIALLIR